MFNGEIGAERFRLEVPPLPLADYVRMQGLLLGPLRSRRPRWSLPVIWMVLFLASFGIIWLSNWLGSFGVLILGSVRFNWTMTIPDAKLVVLACGILFVIVALLFLAGRRQHTRLVRRFHAASRTINSPHELVLGEDGLTATSPLTRLSAPWSTITAHVAASGTHFLVIDRLSALWIPESAFPNLMERDVLLAFLAEKVRPAA